jgi:hypothetical protein
MSNQLPAPVVIPEGELKRPGSVVVVAILVFIIALTNLVAAIAAVYLAQRPGEQQTLYGASSSDWVFYFSALMSFILFLIYLWVGRAQLRGDAQAWMIVNLLMIINIFFAFFQLFYGTGFVTIFFALIVLILNNTKNTKPYFMSKLPPEVKAQIAASQEQLAAANAAAVAARQAEEAAKQQPPAAPPSNPGS